MALWQSFDIPLNDYEVLVNHFIACQICQDNIGFTIKNRNLILSTISHFWFEFHEYRYVKLQQKIIVWYDWGMCKMCCQLMTKNWHI